LVYRKSPVALIKPHKVSAPNNSGSLNKYIEGFIHDVVDSTKKGNNGVNRIIETMMKGCNEENQKSKSTLNNSIIHSMSNHMNSAVHNTQRFKKNKDSNSFYIEVNDYKSIALNTAPIDTNIKMRSPFVSKTERYPDIKLSPGPGSYNVDQEVSSVNQSEMLMSPQAFGSTFKHRTHFLNADKTPYGKPTYLDNPGVGHYYKNKTIPKRIKNEILKVQKEQEMTAVRDGYVEKKPAFLGSSGRPCMTESAHHDVGPGKYNHDKEITNDKSKFAIPKSKDNDTTSIFISSSPRFKDIMGMPGLKTTKAKYVDDRFNGLQPSYKLSPASRKTSRLKKLKKENFQSNLINERSKQSFNFKSKSKRFSTPKPLRIEDMKEREFKALGNHASLLGSHYKHLYMNEKDKSQLALLTTSYATTIGVEVPFNSQSPRFSNATKNTSKTPGPGSYGDGVLSNEHDLKRALCEAEGIIAKRPIGEMTAAFKSASRLKYSMIDTAIKEKAFLNGPGSYNTNRSTIKKKTFNYSLAN
jgi:hypothetical protein